MINAVLFLLLKCVLYLKGTWMFAKLVVSFIESYEKDSNVVIAGVVVLTFLTMIFLFGFGIYDVVTDVIRMGALI